MDPYVLVVALTLLIPYDSMIPIRLVYGHDSLTTFVTLDLTFASVHKTCQHHPRDQDLKHYVAFFPCSMMISKVDAIFLLLS